MITASTLDGLVVEGLAEPLAADVDDVASGLSEGEDARNPAAPSLGAVVEEEALQVALPRLAPLVEHVLSLRPEDSVKSEKTAWQPGSARR